MAHEKFLLGFLDIETTGHDPLKQRGKGVIPWHEIIDIGCVLADPHTLEIAGEYGIKIHPKHPERCLPDLINHYVERAARGEWDDAVPLKTGLLSLFAWIAERRAHHCGCPHTANALRVVLYGQNFSFDWSFLTVAFAQAGMDETVWKKYFHYARIDTRSMAEQELYDASVVYDPSNHSLRNGRLQEKLGLTPEPIPHIALTGARQAYVLYKKLRQLALLRK